VPSETLAPTVSLEWTTTITPSPTPSATGTPELPVWTLERKCSVPEPLLEDESIGEGTILYANEQGVFVTQGSLAESKRAFYAEDPTLHVSPDGQHLVVTRFDHVPPLVVVMNLDGSHVLEFPWPDSYPEIPSYGITWFTKEWLEVLGDDELITFLATTGESGNSVKSSDFPWSYWNSDLARAVYADHDGRFIHLGLPIPGEWTNLKGGSPDYYTPNNLKEVKVYWGKGREPLVAMETAAVGPAYVGSIIYIHDLRGTPNLGFFNAIDSGGQIQDGDIDIYMGFAWKEYYMNRQIYFGGSGWANLEVWLATPIQ
jgi:hypothetical protein